MPAFAGGAPLPVTTGGGGRADGRKAVLAYVVAAPGPIAGRARRVVVAAAGTPTEGGSAIPIFDAGPNALFTAEPPLLIVLASGSLS